MPILAAKWRKLVLLPAANILFVIIFWQSQIEQYQHSTKGILYMWLVAGLLFLLIQISLLIGAWHAAAKNQKDLQLRETQWLLGTQLGMFAVATVYNATALTQLTLLGARPTGILNISILFILLTTLVIGAVRYRSQITKPDARLLLATGTKAVPQWLQAIGLLVLGSGGMHYTTIGAITAMGTTRFLLAKQAVNHFSDKNTLASYKIAFRDLASILTMGLAWIVTKL